MNRENEILEEGLRRASEARRKRREEQENAGADLADNHFCPSCGARGFRFTCDRCSRQLG